jgi:septum formation protein
LASASPRRRELLNLCGRPFDIQIAKVNERTIVDRLKTGGIGQSFDVLAEKIVIELAGAKAEAIHTLHPSAVVIGADTVVISEEKIIGKPRSEKEAMEMLKNLCGRKHHVLTGVSIVSTNLKDVFFSKASVEFYPYDEMTKELIRRYVETGSPMDKAGAYGIQDMGALLVKRIEGDFYTVMGLPVAELWRRLAPFL